MLPPARQTLFFSATMPPEITRLVERFLKDPQRIEAARPATTASTITQRFLRCPSDPKAKRSVLRNLIHAQPVKNAIIFCNRKRDVAILHKSLIRHGFNAGALHGDMDQSARTATLDGFRSGAITLLAASDVAARGLDIPDVSHIFNYDVPVHSDDYVHRIGRTGRAGKEGFSATLVTPEDSKMMRMIEKMVGTAPVWLDGIEPEPSALEGEGGRGRDRGGRGRERGGRERTGRGRRDEAAPTRVADTAELDEIEVVGGAGQVEETSPEHNGDHEGERNGTRPSRPRRTQRQGQSRQELRTDDARPEEPRREPRRDEAPRTSADRGEPVAANEARDDPRSDDLRRPARPARPAPERREPRSEPRREPRPEARSDQRSDRGGTRAEPRHDRSQRHGGRGGDAPVLGLGDHVPEFLKRPVKIS